MAFDLSAMGVANKTGLTLGNWTGVQGTTFNSYAHVTAISGNTVTIDTTTASIGSFDSFTVGADILIHVSAAVSSADMLGKYIVATVTNVSNNVLTFDKDISKVIPANTLTLYHVQAVAIARFDSLTLASGETISPPAYNVNNYFGGIVAMKCFGNLNLNGGSINLSGKGIPTSNKALRPLTKLENYNFVASDYPDLGLSKTFDEYAASDEYPYAGWENSQTRNAFTLNCGDGAAFIIVYGTTTFNSSSRIGNPSTKGVQFCRGASDSVGDKPSGITNRGGSTILLASKSISNFNPAVIAKYRSGSTGTGLCRAYIASDTKLRNDEGLYAYDSISNPMNLQEMNIVGFGDGSAGNATDVTGQVNSYAKISAIGTDRKTLVIANKSEVAVAKFVAGTMVMIHAGLAKAVTEATAPNIGKFILAKIVGVSGTNVTVDTAVPSNLSTSDYALQLVTIPQFANFTLSGTNTGTPKFENGRGGIFAIAVKNTCNISGGKIDVVGKGGGYPYGRVGLGCIGNAQMRNRLPIGEGNGSVFILAKSLTMSSGTRIGGSVQSSNGTAGDSNSNPLWDSTHPDGVSGFVTPYRNGVYLLGGGYKTASIPNVSYTPASGADGGGGLTSASAVKALTVGNVKAFAKGGYGSNGILVVSGSHSHRRNAGGKARRPLEKVDVLATYQGAHLFIVADTVTGFRYEGIATGGEGGFIEDSNTTTSGAGSPGYGGGGAYIQGEDSEKLSCAGGGAYNGGGNAGYGSLGCASGGSAGWAFIYCNNVVSTQFSIPYSDLL